MADKAGVRILVVDDEPHIRELVGYNLQRQGYEVGYATDGEEALRKVKAEQFDLMILDLMLPGMDGIQICRIIKSDQMLLSMPIIMLTAKTDESDRVVGLDMGADDYVTKPFGVRELMARVKALLRRTKPQGQEKVELRIGPLVIDTETYTVNKNGAQLDLSATEFRLLRYLAEHAGKVYSRDQLLDAVWRDESYVEPRTVDVHVRRLRAQIEDDPANPEIIKTKRGVGYYAAG